jgi:methionine biosynthesis protein MetW
VDPLRYDVDRPLDPNEVPGIVAGMIPRGAKVLDIGCGEGTLTKVLADACHAEFFGIEADPIRAARAAARGLNVRVGFFDPQMVRDLWPFDIVLFADVLEHLPNPQSVLVACHEILSPRGAVVVSVPNVAHWSVRAELLQGRFRYQATGIMDATHLRWFTAGSAKALLESAGFEVVGFRSTAGVNVPDNTNRAPLCWMPQKRRDALLRVGARRWPTLLGAQHVIKAKVK